MNRICVYCGSSAGQREDYADAARALGRLLVERGLGLVYGGASVGVMGAIADAVLDGGGEAIGIIPRALAVKEVQHTGLTQQHVVESMHERKALMAEMSDGFVALPGGWGTLEEIFEILTWAQLGFHAKPCGLLNVAGYYDDLFRFLGHARKEGFVRDVHHGMLLMEAEPSALLDRFEAYHAPKIRKWITREET